MYCIDKESTDVSLFLVSNLSETEKIQVGIQMTEINIVVIKAILLCLHSSVYFRT